MTKTQDIFVGPFPDMGGMGSRYRRLMRGPCRIPMQILPNRFAGPIELRCPVCGWSALTTESQLDLADKVAILQHEAESCLTKGPHPVWLRFVVSAH